MTYQPYGDPAAIRREASDLKAKAESLGHQASLLDRHVAAMDLEGPFASRFRNGMVQNRAAAIRAAGELQDHANMLLRRAATIEEQNAGLGGFL